MTKPGMTLLLIAASISVSEPAHAQLGAMIKKKVKEAVSKPETPKPEEKTSTSRQASTSRTDDNPTGFGSAIVELTPASFDDFMRALRNEITAQGVLRKEIARYGTSDVYEACKARAAQTPEGKKIMEPFYNPPKDIKPEDYMKLQSKVVNEMDAFTTRSCPLNPAYWSPSRTEQSTDSIRADVTVALGRNIDVQKYAVALERIDRLCRYKGMGPDNSPAEGATPQKFAGIGKEIYWMYTAAEVESINSARCREYYALIPKLMK